MSTLNLESRLPTPSVLVRNRCNVTLIDTRFVPLIEAAIAAYLETLPGVTDIRLQGSVARGEAIIGQSDIDFTALVVDELDDDTFARLQDLESKLSRRYSVVSRVELNVSPLNELVPFQRFSLSSDSLSVYGKDSLTQHEQRIDRVELARLVTPPAATLILDYRTLVVEARDGVDEAEMRFYSRIVGKDLLNCLRALILLGGGEYEVAIDRIHAQANVYVPELAALAGRLYMLYRAPSTDPELVLATLDHAEATLLPAMRGIC